eukprot:MONOS_8649.1-p1 / transcript=MONOS_8649.1 / gene=MONOS_8649 / organism=Monocercomonoides_exilis_PA203 / gene_product=unspecified product / transcript_product=unspecified product / location=Mono_scaffold00331:33808-34290(+) / protein_length=137 / sequence_SO=supercontig / SO=protein_coding / is_pseudo=false
MEQKQKIEEMNGMMDKMDENELRCVLTNEKMGYLNALKSIYSSFFEKSSLVERFERLVIEEEKKNEEKKNEEKNEKLLIDLCECYLFLIEFFSSESISISVSCLLVVALKKEENEETQKEVEMALLALSRIEIWKV